MMRALDIVATAAALSLFAVLVIACLETEIPPGTRDPTPLERSIVIDKVARWTDRLGLPHDRCIAEIDRLRILDADTETQLAWCALCPPSRYVPECDSGYPWRTPGCPIYREHTPVIVLFAGLGHADRVGTIGHETTHHLGHCAALTESPGAWHLDHRNPLLWGSPDGVHPL